MKKFRRKSVVVEAVLFFPSDIHSRYLPDGVVGLNSPGADNWGYQGCRFFVTTIHGDKIEVFEGDWIITEPDGKHHYPCKPDIFDTTYEPVDKEPGDAED